MLYGRSCLNSEFFHHPLTLISALLLAGALPAAALFRAGRYHHHGSRAHRQMYADRAQENTQRLTDMTGRDLIRTAQREFKFALLCYLLSALTGLLTLWALAALMRALT